MAMHAIIGGVVLVAGLISTGIVATVVAVSLRSLGRESGPEIRGHIYVSSSSGLFPKQGSWRSAQCYWDCMSDFRWDEDWKGLCAPACGLAEKRKEIASTSPVN